MTAAQPVLRGRPPTPETALQVAEGHFFEIGAELIRGRDNLRAYPDHDDNEDAEILAMLPIADWLLAHPDPAVKAKGRELRARVERSRHHDRLADAVVGQGEYRVDRGLVHVQIACTTIEHAETGTYRHQPVRRPTDAAQLTLGAPEGLTWP